MEILFYILTNFSDGALGGYDVQTGQIYIQRGLDKETREYVLTHEKMHHKWFTDLTEIQRRLYCRRFDRGKVRLVSEYSKTSCEEAYAEMMTHKHFKNN